MIRCKYSECIWPNCDNSCGMDEPHLIAHLQSEVRKYRQEKSDILKTLGSYITPLYNSYEHYFDKPYIPTCPFGEHNCIHDPAYQRKYSSKIWEQNGMPTECECYEEFLNEYNNDDPFGSSLDVAMSFGCPYYDDEDK